MKNDSIRIIKPNYIDGLKKFTSLIVAKKLNVDDLNYVISKYKIENNIIKKLFSYICSFPNVINYMNRHLNRLGNSYDLIEFIQTWRYILSANNILDSRKFLYFKASDSKNDLQMKIIDLLDRYFNEVHGISYNYRELVFYYNLFLVGKITKEEIYEIDLLMNGNKKTIDLPDFSAPENKERISVKSLIKNAKAISGPIDDLNNAIYKKKIELCKDCPHMKNEIVPFDGNLKNSEEELDVLIINLNPNLDDAKNKQIFKESSIVRQNILLFPKDYKWILMNLIPCAFKSKSEIGGSTEEILKQVEKCSPIISEVIDKYTPRFVILIGEEVTSHLIPAAEFSKSLGCLVEDKYFPVFHPNSMRNMKAQQRGKEAWNNVQNKLFSAIPSTSKPEPDEEPVITKKSEKEKPKTINTKKIDPKKNESLLLFDVKELSDGSILMIYIDDDGNKVYEKKKNVQTSYVKNTDFKECGIITSDVDYEFTMNKYQKFQLTKLLKNELTALKRGKKHK